MIQKANINVGISDWKIGKSGDIIVTYALGSCVGICLWDKTKLIGGMSHIMLPDSKSAGEAAPNRMKFADTAIPDLASKLRAMGAGNLTAKIAGGAMMFNTTTDKFNIGERNVTAVRAALSALRIAIIAHDTGLNYGRTLYLSIEDGKVEVKATGKEQKSL